MISAIACIVLTGVFVDYFTLLPQRKIHKELRRENVEYRSRFQNAAGKLGSIQAELKQLKTFAEKLRFITSINDPERGLRLSMKPQTNSSQAALVIQNSRVIDDREPTALSSGPIFKEKTLKELTGRELHRGDETSYSDLSSIFEQALRESEVREKDFLELWELLQDRSELLASTPSMKPARGNYSSRFGYRLSPYGAKPMMHEGLDIAAAPGTPVYAPADGVIRHAGYDGGYGRVVEIDHGYGVETRYGHNSRVFVKAGQKVKRGDLVSAVGSTGRSTGPHLHYEVRVNGQPVDPVNYILEE
jgi:murein DD-endopeptidase MepM/ murein hydrolase activator NlpD